MTYQHDMSDVTPDIALRVCASLCGGAAVEIGMRSGQMLAANDKAWAEIHSEGLTAAIADARVLLTRIEEANTALAEPQIDEAAA